MNLHIDDQMNLGDLSNLDSRRNLASLINSMAVLIEWSKPFKVLNPQSSLSNPHNNNSQNINIANPMATCNPSLNRLTRESWKPIWKIITPPRDPMHIVQASKKQVGIAFMSKKPMNTNKNHN